MLFVGGMSGAGVARALRFRRRRTSCVKFMFLFRGGGIVVQPPPPPAEIGAHLAKWTEWVGGLVKAGHAEVGAASTRERREGRTGGGEGRDGRPVRRSEGPCFRDPRRLGKLARGGGRAGARLPDLRVRWQRRGPPPPRDAPRTMTTRDEHALAVLFRQESGRLVATLTRFFGVGELALAEDVAQETLARCAPGVEPRITPEPSAWLFHVAKNRARDMVRRRRVRRGPPTALDPDDLAAETTTGEDVDADVLRMMFSCCHPALTEDTQTALILRLVCGFGTNEVALAFFSEPSAMEKRLVRAKKVLADEGRLFEPTTHAEARRTSRRGRAGPSI